MNDDNYERIYFGKPAGAVFGSVHPRSIRLHGIILVCFVYVILVDLCIVGDKLTRIHKDVAMTFICLMGVSFFSGENGVFFLWISSYAYTVSTNGTLLSFLSFFHPLLFFIILA